MRVRTMKDIHYLTNIITVGNSYGVIVPKKQLEAVGIQKGDQVEVTIQKTEER